MFDKQFFIFLELEDVEDLFEGHVDIGRVEFGPTCIESPLLSTSRVPFDGGSCLFYHIVMNSLPLFFLPMMHPYLFYYVNKQQKQHRKPPSSSNKTTKNELY